MILGEYDMSSNEANDYKILSIDTDVKVPKVEETNENNTT